MEGERRQPASPGSGQRAVGLDLGDGAGNGIQREQSRSVQGGTDREAVCDGVRRPSTWSRVQAVLGFKSGILKEIS